REHSVLQHELPGAIVQVYDGVGPVGGRDQSPVVDHLDEAGAAGPDLRTLRSAARPDRVELGSPARPSTRVCSLPSLAIPIYKGVVEVTHDAGHHVLELDGHGDAMAEDQEEAEAHSHQNDAGADGELGNEQERD